MAEETLVKETLTEEMLDSGRELIRALRDRQINVTACFWLYSAETNDWKLAVSFPQVRDEGPRKAYEIIQSVVRPKGLSQFEPERFKRLLRLFLDDVIVYSPSHQLVRSISEVSLDPHWAGTRLKRSRIGDTYFDDVYIYDLNQATE